ncbi:MAG: pyrroline-5-carboxylate reductase [Deltaproteobacteria bacterium]|nr:pyrroline-5-carboxylate reductase [Deltaproteobacteria bacterium]
MSLSEKRIGFIGCGKMGQALIRGLVDSEATNGVRIMGYDTADFNWPEMLTKWGASPAKSNPEVVVLAVQPQYAADALAEIKDHSAGKLIISIVAGLTTKTIEKSLDPKARVVRVMPNTPALVRQGASAVAPGASATKHDLSLAKQLMSNVGLVVIEKEGNMDAVTGMSGTGPAFVFLFLDGLIGAGVRLGLSWDVAKTLAYQTVKGAAVLAQQSDQHVAQLKDDVTSPGGTSAAGLYVLEGAGFKAMIAQAVEAAAKRSEELGRQ